jgi:6-phosphogluconolactonase
MDLRKELLMPGLLAMGCGAGGQASSDAAPTSPADASSADVDSVDVDSGDALPSYAADASAVDAWAVGDVSVPGDASDAARGPARLVAYASGYGPNISFFSVDGVTGGLAPLGSIAAFGSSPSFLACNRAMTNLYAVDENPTGRVGAYAIDPATGTLSFLNAVSSGGSGPAFVSVDATGKFVLVANYGDGSVSVLPVGVGGRLGAASDTQMVGAQAHMILADPSNRFVLVPCKGVDYVAEFLFDATNGKLTANAKPRVSTAPGAGPRHLAFHPNGRFAYLINELNSTMTAYAFDTAAGGLTEIETKSTLPAGFTGTNTAAEVWVHPSGQWVFGSNRGDDSIATFALDASTGKMTLKGFTKAGGATPRDFVLDPSGTYLYVANQGSSTVVPFRFDGAQGSLAPVAKAVAVASVACVGLGSL